MNENIDLTQILKDCPKGTKLYTPLAGEVTFKGVYNENTYPIEVINKFDDEISFDSKGRYFSEFDECLLFPSKENRDWSKFKAPWTKNEKV